MKKRLVFWVVWTIFWLFYASYYATRVFGQELDTLDYYPVPDVVVGEVDTERHRFNPPSTYAMLWYEVENCLGVRKDFRDVVWYWVQADRYDSVPCSGGTCYGYYQPWENSITLANSLLWSEVLVKHEMIHALGVHQHPPQIFAACAGHRVGTKPTDGPYIPGRIR